LKWKYLGDLLQFYGVINISTFAGSTDRAMNINLFTTLYYNQMSSKFRGFGILPNNTDSKVGYYKWADGIYSVYYYEQYLYYGKIQILNYLQGSIVIDESHRQLPSGETPSIITVS
jgi:hypothetical protein